MQSVRLAMELRNPTWFLWKSTTSTSFGCISVSTVRRLGSSLHQSNKKEFFNTLHLTHSHFHPRTLLLEFRRGIFEHSWIPP
jgi:hypothetical protein